MKICAARGRPPRHGPGSELRAAERDLGTTIIIIIITLKEDILLLLIIIILLIIIMIIVVISGISIM